MNAPRPAELARRLFGSVRRERPSAELRARILVAGRAELERVRGLSSLEARRLLGESPERASVSKPPGRAGAVRRWLAVGAFAAAAGLIVYLSAGRAPESDVTISAEHKGSPQSARAWSQRVGSGRSGRADVGASGNDVEPAPARLESAQAPVDLAKTPATPDRPVRAAPSPLARTPHEEEAADDATPNAPRPSPSVRDRRTTSGSTSPTRAVIASPPPIQPDGVGVPASEAAPRASLEQQLEQIKGVRAALRARDPRRALQLIDAYRSGGSGVELAAEASLLRIEALAMSEQNDAAAQAARQFARDYPNSPLIDRALSYARAAKR